MDKYSLYRSCPLPYHKLI